jgi:hypothetical protein
MTMCQLLILLAFGFSNPGWRGKVLEKEASRRKCWTKGDIFLTVPIFGGSGEQFLVFLATSYPKQEVPKEIK